MVTSRIYTKYIIGLLLLMAISYSANYTIRIYYTNHISFGNGTIDLHSYENPDMYGHGVQHYYYNITNGTVFIPDTDNLTGDMVYAYKIIGNGTTQIYNGTVYLTNNSYIFITNNPEYTLKGILYGTVNLMFRHGYILLVNIGAIIVFTYVYGIAGIAFGSFIMAVVFNIFLMIGFGDAKLYEALNIAIFIASTVFHLIGNRGGKLGQ